MNNFSNDEIMAYIKVENVEKQQPTYKEQGKYNTKLINCLSQNIFHHCPGDKWFCSSIGLPQQ
jgi:hypothetical protein